MWKCAVCGEMVGNYTSAYTVTDEDTKVTRVTHEEHWGPAYFAAAVVKGPNAFDAKNDKPFCSPECATRWFDSDEEES